MAASLRLSDNQFHIAGPATKSPPTITAETMARHDEKTLLTAGNAVWVGVLDIRQMDGLD